MGIDQKENTGLLKKEKEKKSIFHAYTGNTNNFRESGQVLTL